LIKYRLTKIARRQRTKKIRVRGDVRSSMTCAVLNLLYTLFALRTIVAQPTLIKTSAAKSYRQMKASPRTCVDKNIAKMIAVHEVTESSVRSIYLRRYKCNHVAIQLIKKPRMNLQEQ